MFQIIVIPVNSNAPAALIYKTREMAEAQLQNFHEMQKGSIGASVIQAKDEFGCVLSMPVANVSYVLFVDVQKQQELGIPPNRGANASK